MCAYCEGSVVARCDECSRPVCRRHRNRDNGKVWCKGCRREAREDRIDSVHNRSGTADPELVSVVVHPRGKAGWMQRKRLR